MGSAGTGVRSNARDAGKGLQLVAACLVLAFMLAGCTGPQRPSSITTEPNGDAQCHAHEGGDRGFAVTIVREEALAGLVGACLAIRISCECATPVVDAVRIPADGKLFLALSGEGTYDFFANAPNPHDQLCSHSAYHTAHHPGTGVVAVTIEAWEPCA